MPLGSTDGTFTIGRDTFPDFGRLARLGVHIQSDRVRVAQPDPEYVEAALDALDEACRQLDIPEASIVFVDTVELPPAVGLRYGFKGSYTTDYPTITWVFANWTRLDELREVVRHEAAHLAFARTIPPRNRRVTPDPRRTSRSRSRRVGDPASCTGWDYTCRADTCTLDRWQDPRTA